MEPGKLSKQLIPLVMQMRALATIQPGYISGETLSNVDDPEECVVISRWESINDWNRWLYSKERDEIQRKIDDVTREKTDYKVFEPLIAR